MENKSIEILKTAILLERKGKAFYSHVAAQAQDVDVKEFFQIMADEEEEHIKYLTNQYAKYMESNLFEATPTHVDEHDAKEEILSNKMKEKIESASFEAAAISSAIDMENRAIAVYSERAKSADTKEEREFYQWLADWEKGHHKLLNSINESLKEKIWNDNQFWPM